MKNLLKSFVYAVLQPVSKLHPQANFLTEYEVQILTFGQFLCRFKVLALHFLKFAIFTTTCVPQFFMYCKPLFFGLCVVIFAPQIYLSFQKNYINQLNIAYLAVAIFCKKILECGMKNVGLR